MTETMNARDIEARIGALRKKIDIHLSVGDGDEANKIRDEIGACYRLLMNETALTSKNVARFPRRERLIMEVAETNYSEELASMSADEMASEIVDLTSQSLDALNARREMAYAEACAPLDEELATLAVESDEIQAQAQALIERMASAERVKQYEYDQLVVQGKNEEAQAKLAELEEIRAVPGKIEERRTEIAKRVAELEDEKKAELRRVAVDFREASIKLIRGSETGLADLLDRTRAILNNLETELGAVLYQPGQQTADERSDEWNTLRRAYGGRVR